jgi:peptide/nickel transport system substrate-binding protein
MAASLASRGGSLRGRTARLLGVGTLLTGLIVLAPLAPGGALAQRRAAASFVDSGTLTMVSDGTAADLDPASNELAASDNLAINIDETLVAPDGSSIDRFKPLLATSWSANANKSVWTFSLRHGVRFHTGRCCMTADDVKYNLVRVQKAGLTNSYVLARFISDPDKQIQVTNPYTIRFNLGRPQPIFVDALGQEYAELILDSQALKAHATKSDPWAHLWATDHDAGTGPYTIQSWARGQQTVLARFPAYWGGWSGRHFSKAIVRTLPESSTRRELLERGQADLTFDLTPQDYQALSQERGVKLSAPYGTEVVYIAMTESGPLASPYARQALSYAFDYNAFLAAAYHGYARRAYGPIPSVLLGYDPHMFHYQTDLAKAKALLQKAGVPPGTTLTYVTSPTTSERTAGLILQAQLAQIGINLKVQVLDEAAFNSIFYGTEPASKRPNLMPFGWWPDYNDPYDEAVTLVASYEAGSAGANAGYYHNSQVDALLARMKNANPETLVSAAYTLQDITGRQDPPSIWIAEPAEVTILNKNVQGYVFNPLVLQTYQFYPMYR